MIILGLNINHADTSAVLIKDDKVIFGAEEERFTRIKHFTGFPVNSIEKALGAANISPSEINYVAVNYNANHNLLNKLIFSINRIYKKNIFFKIISFFKKKSLIQDFKKHFNQDITNKIFYVPHHLSHISSTYFIHGINEAVGYSVDGSGDFSTVETFHLEKNNIKTIDKNLYPHSLGIFYQAMTQFLGFKNYGDEYKVMGLASYGKPIFEDRIRKLFFLDRNCNFKLNLKYFDHHNTIVDYNFDSGTPFFEDLYSKNIEKLLGKSRKNQEEINQFHMNLAASVQKVFEEIALKKINYLQKKTNSKIICISGGCAFNSVFNGKIKKNSNFDDVYSSPNVGDAGGALGAALYVAKKFNININNTKNPYIGTAYNNEYIEKNIVKKNINTSFFKQKFFSNRDELNEFVSRKIADKCIVGWFQDRMEWGPRALGNRSILGDPRVENMRELLNLKIKRREEFRPFAPSVLEERSKEYFEIDEQCEYMEKVFRAKKGVEKIIPAVVHVDQTSRVQTVSQNTNIKFYSLIKSFGDKTGVPILLNTSLNVNEPICENPENAMEIFTKTLMEVMVIQDWVFYK